VLTWQILTHDLQMLRSNLVEHMLPTPVSVQYALEFMSWPASTRTKNPGACE
jgi:hypothetical protein